jgi:hypothetical protein
MQRDARDRFDYRAAHAHIAVVKNSVLARCDGPLRLIEHDACSTVIA